jgi:putative oxidoreductase
MNVMLWIVQVLLAAAFGMAGVMKSMMPIDTLVLQVPWADDVPLAMVRFIGISELAGAIGLILPALTRIRQGLTPLAALGLATVMLLASLFHISRGEFGALPITVVLGVMAAFVAWGRRTKAPIAPR